MAKAKKKSEPKLVIPPHPAVASAKEMGAMCAEIYGYAIKVARQDGLDEQQVEQLALGKIQRFMAACIKQSKDDWKAYTKATGVKAAYKEVKKPAKRKSVAKTAVKKK